MKRLLLAGGEWMIFEGSSTSSLDRLWGRRKCVLVATCQPAGDAYCICWKGEFSKQEAFWKASSHSDSWSQTRKKAQRGVQCQSVPRRRLASPRGLGTGPARPGGRRGGKGPSLRDGGEAGEPTTVMGGSAPPGGALPPETCPLCEEFSSAAENLFWTKCYLHRWKWKSVVFFIFSSRSLKKRI